MSDNSNIRNMLELMDGSRNKNEDRWQAQGGKTSYRAADIAPEKMPTLRVHYSSGDIELLSYSYMSTIGYSAVTGAIGIHYSAGQAALYGKNLRLLLDHFEGSQIKRVVPFNPNIHIPPTEGEPLIEEILFWPRKDAEQS